MANEIIIRIPVPHPPDDVATIRAAAKAATEATSLRATALAIGCSPLGLKKFLLGSAPYSPTLRRLRKWYAKHASTESEG